MKSQIIVPILLLASVAHGAGHLILDGHTDYSSKLVFEAQAAAKKTKPVTINTGEPVGNGVAIPLVGDGSRRPASPSPAIVQPKPLTKAQKVQNEINQEIIAMNKQIWQYNQFRSAGNITGARKLLPVIADYQASIKAMKQEKASY
ncbi:MULTISPECIES: hypothetical protein [Snodgrassella]|uniref:hypothetical protein n=1 Tax=Snodgrassella TaxID=1193515 RepID=UPI0008159948|nr:MULTISPECIES: hypothetical protein [Snodgrassella]SCC03997.1 hypothetical protein GA0061082_1078 [Snodgrassella sp. R-53583]